MAQIGFIGLGHMGLPMACNLLKAGYTVSGFDIVQEAMHALVEAGGSSVPQYLDLASTQDVIITMLQTGQQVKALCLGAQGLFRHAKTGTLFIDCSTIDVESARELHDEAQKNNLFLVDAPVSGGTTGASAATLTFMVGGSNTAFDKAKPFLSVMGKTILHTGNGGNGQAAKICNNMALGISMIAISEAFILGEKLGLTKEQLFEVLRNASGQCWVVNHYVPVPGLLENVPANRDYQPGFTTAMMLKDLHLSQMAAQAVEANTPLGQHATALYEQAKEQGLATYDFSAIIQMIKTAQRE